MRFLLVIVAVSMLSINGSGRATEPLVVHEWGTFTSLQDEDGYAIGGINSDDEPLPPFVHDLIRDGEKDAARGGKGIPDRFPSVTMRLETPVLYFHPAAGAKPFSVDVSAEFHGGLLSQFYPMAAASVPKLNGTQLEPITPETIGTLAWHNIIVGGERAGPQTDLHVWTAPRTAASANVQTIDGESESFLFYRGVGHIDAPLNVVRSGSEITVHGQLEFATKDVALLNFDHIFFCQFLSDGRCAWKAVHPVDLNFRTRASAVPASFGDGEFSADNLRTLKSAMHKDLVDAGLFDDEATAMLSTWELSYFKTAGTRLFFLVPRNWTDHYLPLHVSVPADIQRVMMGRIDLVTPEDRRVLHEMETLTPSNSGDLRKLSSMYQSLGRFRSALVLDELRRHPTETLRQFSGMVIQ